MLHTHRAWNRICESTAWVKVDQIGWVTTPIFAAAPSQVAAAFPRADPDDMLRRLLLFAAFARPWPSARAWDASRVLSPVQLRRLIRAYKRENGPDHAIA